MKVALIRPHDSEVLDADLGAPQNLVELGTQLRRAGHDVDILDFGSGGDYEELSGYDIYGLSIITPLWDEAIKCAKVIRRNNPSAWIIAGGRHVTYVQTDEQLRIFDAVFVGEADETLLRFLEKPLKGRIHVSGPPVDIDKIHPIDWGMVNLSRYRHRTIDGVPADSALLSRGCPYSCAFCATSKSKPRTLSLSNIRSILDNVKPEAMFFVDDTFTLIATDKILACLLGIVWGCLGRADHITDELASRFYKHGCRYIFIGVESGSQQMLDLMNKRENIKDIEKALRILSARKIFTKISIIVGFPGETWDTISETIKFLKNVPFDTIAINAFVSYPGSDVYRNPSKYHIQEISKDFSQYRQANKAFGFRLPHKIENLTHRDIKSMFQAVADTFSDRRQYFNDSEY